MEDTQPLPPPPPAAADATSDDDGARTFPMPWDMSLAEQRVFARAANKNLIEVQREFQKAHATSEQMKTDGVPDEEVEDFLGEFMARTMGDPWIGPAFLLVAARREFPRVTMGHVINRLEAGLWQLVDAGANDAPAPDAVEAEDNDADDEEAVFDPLDSATVTPALPSLTS